MVFVLVSIELFMFNVVLFMLINGLMEMSMLVKVIGKFNVDNINMDVNVVLLLMLVMLNELIIMIVINVIINCKLIFILVMGVIIIVSMVG